MSRSIPVVALALWVAVALLTSGCPQAVPVAIPAAPTPPVDALRPRLRVRANPMFRLVIPRRSLDDPARLIAILVRVENIHDQPLGIRPERILLELPDGSRRFALDLPRAREIVERTTPARAELLYLKHNPLSPPGGMTPSLQQYWRERLGDDLLAHSLLSPGDSAEGFVVVDTARRFASLQDTVVEAFAEPAAPQNPPNPVRVLLGAPIDVGP
jgi:hypothetical protein